MITTQEARIGRLRRAIDGYVRRTGSRIIHSVEEQQAFAKLAHEVYSANRAKPEIIRKAEFLRAFAEAMPVSIGDDELIVGSQQFTGRNFARFLTEKECADMALHGNIGHIIVDYGRVLQEGVGGLRERIGRMNARSPVKERNRAAFLDAIGAFSTFIERHAEAAQETTKACDDPDRKAELLQIANNCEWIAQHAPRTFWEALQLAWFIQVFLYAEGLAAAVSFGRFDHYMWPFLDRDLRAGTLTMDAAEELLCCFSLKCCEGDESQNLTVGGVDEEGLCAENPLSLLCLQVTRELKVWQPSVSVRIGPETSEAFWREAVDLCAVGTGQPSFFNDPVVIRSLEAVDIPPDRARDWGIVGCYEATPQGDTYGVTVGGGLVLPSALLDFLRNEMPATSFEEFYREFKTFLGEYYSARVKEYQKHWNSLCERGASPFESLCLTGCLESGLSAEEGGGRFNLFGVNILGLGTLVDSLLALKMLVYDEGCLSIREMKSQLDADFPDNALLARCRNLPGKFGSDSDLTNELARDLSSHIADLVLACRLANGVRPYPGFFRFMADIRMSLPATPDGRRSGERVSYGAGPSELCKDRSPTSVANSAARVAHERCACGNPLLLSLTRNDIQGKDGRRRIQDIVETYFQQGGFHLHINILSAAELREAKKNPHAHSDLTVRVSGYSARFTALDDVLQNAIIERTEKGM